MPIPTPTPRAERVTGLFDFTQGHGLEIGPLFQPLIPRDAADVSYADVFDREALVAHYDTNPNVTLETVPELDYVLWDGERVRTIDEAAKPGAPFDWVYASHVVEHVPDVIGWLRQIEAITADDGHLILVVPDRRYSFDAHRPPTTVGQMLQAYESGDVVPSVRAVYDHHRSAVNATARELWRGAEPGYDARIHDLGYVNRQLEKARDGEYVDCHVWTFTDKDFVEVIDELREMNLTSWWVKDILPTPEKQLEFYVVLARGPRPEGVEPVAAPTAPDWFAEQRELHRRIRRLRRRLRQQRKANRALRSSRRWKVAGLLASPLDALRRRR